MKEILTYQDNIQSKVGNKAYTLYKLKKQGFNIPNFLVIDAITIENFIGFHLKEKDIDEQIHKAKSEVHLPKDFLYTLKKRINETLQSDKFAVRSSCSVEDGAKNSWAGQFTSFLNVSLNELEEKVIHCWFSMYSLSALEYGRGLNLSMENCKMNILIQDMVLPDFSGVIFTQNPIKQHSNEVVIEYTEGMGNKLVSGETNCNLFVYNVTNNIIVKHKQHNESMLEQELIELVQLALEVESFLDYPCDIEWAFKDNNFYVLQARPIIFPKENLRLMVSHQSDLLTQDLVLSGVYKYCDFKKYGLNFKFPHIKYYSNTGDIYYPDIQVKEFERKEISLNELNEIVINIKNTIDDFDSFLKTFKKSIDSDDRQKSLVTLAKEFFDNSYKVVGYIPYFICFEIVLDRMLRNEEFSLSDIPTAKTKTVKAYNTLSEIKQKYLPFLLYVKENTEQLPNGLVNDLSEFCSQFGYLGMLYFKGRPWGLSDAFKILLDDNLNIETNSTKVELELDTTYQKDLVNIAKEMLELRTVKWEIMCYACSLFREFIIKYFSGIIDYDNILKMRIEQVINLLDFRLSSKVLKQVKSDFSLEITEEGVIVQEKIISHNNKKQSLNVKRELKGETANQGMVEGYAKKVLSPLEIQDFNVGDILVTKMSTPNFLPLMKKASAFITEIGGITSHAAIISRELNKPCIIGVKNLLDIVQSGDWLVIDAFKGTIKILDEK